MTTAQLAAAYRSHVVHDALIHRQKGFAAQLDIIDRHFCEVSDPACRLEITAHRDRLLRLVEDCRLSLEGDCGTDAEELAELA